MWTLLQQRRREGAGAPFVTSIDAATGERTELSAVSLENAAAKIANALRDEYDLEAGSVVGLHLPQHWQRSAWCAGVWTAGCIVAPWATDVDLVVTTAGAAGGLTDPTGEVAVVSLHPFGLPVEEALPPGAHDVTLAVRQQPDAYLYDLPSASSPAFRMHGILLDQSALLGVARERAESWGLEPGGRLLVGDAATPDDAWLAALVVPLAVQGSVVLVSGPAGDDRIAEQERVTARVR